MLRLVRNIAWLVSLVGMLAIGTGGLRALHHHQGDVGSVFAGSSESSHAHEHGCEADQGSDHAHAPATPAHDHHPASGDDEEHCVTCQLISVFSKVDVSATHSIALFVEPQTIDIVVTRRESVSSHFHFDPHTPRGPPLA